LRPLWLLRPPSSRGRIEAGLRIAEPFLNLLLAAGDRVSRIVEPRDLDHVPARPVGAISESARRTLPPETR
jgi:hypothetical protein